MLRLAAGAMAAASSVFMKAPALSMEKETPGETATWRGMAGSIRVWGRHRAVVVLTPSSSLYSVGDVKLCSKPELRELGISVGNANRLIAAVSKKHKK